MAINTSNNKVRIISTTVSGLSANSKFSDIKSPALVVNTSEGGIFYADGAGGTSLKQLAALPSHTHSGYATTTQLVNYLPLVGGTMNSTAYIAWNTGADGNDISDWNTITSNGLRIISSTTTNANAPIQYSTALHVKGRYGFQIASQGGESTTFYIRNIDTRSNSWQTLIHSGNIGSQSVASATNADTATKSTNSYRLLSNSNSDPISQDNAYDVNPGLHFWKVLADASNNANDGFIFQWNWSAGSVGGQLYVDDNPTNTMMIRGRNQNNGAYTKWNKFLHDGNYTDYCSSLGHGHSNYLPKSGGTLTSSGVTTLNLVDTARNESGISYAGNGGAQWFVGKGVGDIGEKFGFYNNYKGVVANLDINGNLTATKFIGPLQGNADSATVMSSFDTASQTTTLRYVWMSYDDNTGKPAYTDKLTFQTSTNTLFVNDKAVSLEGHTHSYLPLAGGTLTGQLKTLDNFGIILRPGNGDYLSGISSDSAGDECIALWAKNTVTRLRWHAGIDMSDTAYNKMMRITPDFEISKASGTAIGYIAGNTIIHGGNYTTYCASAGHTHSYLPLSGGTVSGKTYIHVAKPTASTITNNTCALIVGTTGAGHTGYHTGIGFNGLSYDSYINHSHAWIGLGKYTTTASAECYPLIFATNNNTTVNTAPTERMRITPDGKVGINTTSPSYTLHVDGSVYGTNFITSSDKRLKENFSDISNAERSLEIPFYEFDYKDDKRHSYGHIAQDVEEIYPTVVTHDNTDDDYLALDYMTLHTIQIKALLDRIIKLEEEIKILKSSK